VVGSKAEDAADCGLVTAEDRRDVGDGIDRKRVQAETVVRWYIGCLLR
jgi:hypothetical protein